MIENLISNLLNEIEKISFRIKFIEEIYDQIISNKLKKRILDEHKDLIQRLEVINNKVKLVKSIPHEKISYSSLLIEKYNRNYKNLSKYNKLFFV